MTRYISSHRSQLLGLSLTGLLALAILFLVQASPLVAPEISRRTANSESGASAAAVDPLANVDPADRKFFTSDYGSRRSAMTTANFWANVHPADRKFFTGNYTTASATSGGVQPAAEAADYKLQDPGYLETLTSQIRIDPLANVHPADRKFFTNGYIWTAPAGEEVAGSD